MSASANVGFHPAQILPENEGQQQHYVGKTAEEMDEERKQQMAYQYLCHLEEAKKWMERCLGEELPATTELEDSLRNGVILAKLAASFAPSVVKLSKIFDIDERKYREMGLHFRHTDNINYFMTAIKFVGLPLIFAPETTDIYDMKNMPRLIFCIHALALYLFQKGIVRHQIQDLYGKVTFTQEEISVMRQALEAVGLRMLPQFRRIGGMLADEVPIDAAALHAAIIAINEAIDQNCPDVTLMALQNPNACLSDIDPELKDKYHIVLVNGKSTKLAKNCENFATDGDAYDEMLTREEIQSMINKMNLLIALERVEECVRNRDLQNLQYALMSRHINIKSQVKANKLEAYCQRLADILAQSPDAFLKPDDVERCLAKVNKQADNKETEEDVVRRINEIVKVGRGESNLFELLSNPVMSLSDNILPFATPLYLSELQYILSSFRKDLKKATIVKTVKFLYDIAKINGAIMNQDIKEFWSLANDPSSKLEDLDKSLCSAYYDAIGDLISQRQTASCWLLNHAELQDCVDQVNAANSTDLKCIQAIERVNEAVMNYDAKALFAAIHAPELNVAEYLKGDEYFENNRLFLTEDDANHFLELLREIQQNRSQAENEESNLWMENILDALKSCRRHCREASNVSTALAIVNMAVLQKDSDHTFETLKHRDLLINSATLRRNLAEDYQHELYTLMKTKESFRGKLSPWVWHRIRSGDIVYLNLQKHNFSWTSPKNFEQSTPQYISTQDIVEVVDKVNQSVDKGDKIMAKLDPLFTHFQARCRGFLVRQKLFTMLEHYYQHEHQVVRIQALWKGILQRREYAKLREEHRTKMAKKRVSVQTRSIETYRVHVKKIIKIQRFWRTQHYKKQFQQLILSTSSDIKLTSLRQFLHLLDLRNEDFEQELELQSLKGQISQLIRHNQALEKDLDAMDIKIGLLIKNRIDLDEVMAHNKLLLSRKQSHKDLLNGASNGPWHEGTLPGGAGNSSTLPRGLKALKRESRQKLDAYQHLFYRLQTCPEYLAKLIFALPQSSSNKFLDSVIMTLYNFGANPREEYMLLKLFQTALEEEVANKVHQLNDIVSGNPLVIKMVVSYYRGKGSLGELLGSLVRSVIDDKNLHINLIPVEIYKQWINSLEFDSGKACGMPYDVSTEEALKYPEVVARFNKSIVQLKQFTTLFLANIVKAKSKNLIPYGLLHLSKVLYGCLKKKFPNAANKDVLKVVGNLIYYRYINSAIVAPDVFGIIDKATLEDGGGLNPDQRRNLGNIAKILQFAAAKKGFGEESSYLIQLNGYIIDCHEKFKKFFAECCADDIVEPSEAFSTDQYTEASLIAKPVIYISLQEICDTHKLLLENVDIIAPDKKDKLRELLEDLGESPSLLSLLGAAASTTENWYDGSLTHLGKTEVCLTLSNKFGFDSVVDRANTDRLFVKTKQLLAAVLPCTKESNLIGCLKSATTQEQSDLYWDLVERKLALDEKAEQNRTMLEHTNLFADDETRQSLDECKIQILKNLQILERHGYVSSKDGCQAILASLAKDICNQKEYRARRRREIFKLRRTIKSLQAKAKFHEEQITSYNAYIKQCLANLQKVGDPKKRVRFTSSTASTGKKQRDMFKAGEKTLRYSASRLHQKGVLLSIDGLPQSQFKNVQFEFVTSGEGVFEIHAKFMGVRLEHVEVDIQDLLQMQYEGATVMNMFGKAKINVNLLLHFLNTKFYGRRR